MGSRFESLDLKDLGDYLGVFTNDHEPRGMKDGVAKWTQRDFVTIFGVSVQ